MKRDSISFCVVSFSTPPVASASRTLSPMNPPTILRIDSPVAGSNEATTGFLYQHWSNQGICVIFSIAIVSAIKDSKAAGLVPYRGGPFHVIPYRFQHAIHILARLEEAITLREC